MLENLVVGAYHCAYTKKELNDKLEEMYEIFPRLAERKKQREEAKRLAAEQRAAEQAAAEVTAEDDDEE